MAPSFMQQIRARNINAADDRMEQAAHAPTATASNPFKRAHDDLAVEWETMREARDNALEEAEHHKGQNVFLASRVDALTDELASRIGFFELELDRLTRRADAATDDAVAIRSKMAVIADALRMVLDSERDVPRQERQPPSPTRVHVQADEPSEAEIVEIGGLLKKLVPVEYPR